MTLLALRSQAQGTWSAVYDWTNQFGPTPSACAHTELSQAYLIPVGKYRGKVLMWHHTTQSATNCAGASTQECWIFDPSSPTQLYLVPQTLTSSIYSSGASWDSAGRLVVAGSLPNQGLPVNASWRFDPTRLGLLLSPQFPGSPVVQWSQAPWTQLNTLASDHYYPAVISLSRSPVRACGGLIGGSQLIVGGSPTQSSEGSELFEFAPQTPTTCTLVPAAGQVHIVGGATDTYQLMQQPDVLLDTMPRAFQLSNGDVFVAGEVNVGPQVPNVPGQTWLLRPSTSLATPWELHDGPDAAPIPGVDPSNDRDVGNAVLLHTLAAPDRVFALGGIQNTSYFAGGNPTPQVNTTLQEFVPGANPPATSTWITHTPTGRNPSGRAWANSVVLPTGKILVVGGSSTVRPKTPLYAPVLYTPAAPGAGSGHGQAMAAPSGVQTPRLYHSLAMLLPDASVLLVGGEDYALSGPLPPAEFTGEVFTPPYPSYRPTIQSVSGATGFYPGVTSFTVQATTVQGAINSVALIRPGANSHHFDADQRYIELAFSASTTAPGPVTLTVTPPTDNLGPPGFYMLFVMESGAQGLAPSTSAQFIQLL